MAQLMIADRPVFEAKISLPLIGVWTIDLVCDGAGSLEGAQTLDIGAGRAMFKGTARRPGAFVDTTHLRLVGGGGGMNISASPKYYDNPTLRLVLSELLDGAGEQLADDADSSILDSTVVGWTVIKRPTLLQIRALLETAAPDGTVYRIKPDGTLLVAPGSFPDSSLTDFVIANEDPQVGRIEIGSDYPDLLPGTTLDGRKISYVEHHITEQAVHTVALYE